MVSTSRSSAQYKFSCCQAHAPVLDHVNPEENGEKSENEKQLSECPGQTVSRTWTLKKDLKNLKASCLENTPQNFLKSFYYSERELDPIMYDPYRGGGMLPPSCYGYQLYNKYNSKCSRVQHKYDGGCENEMQTSVSDDANQLSSLVGLNVDCRNGMKKNGRPIKDGKRRFLRGFKMKMTGGGYRYVYSCCRIQTPFTAK